MPRPTQFKNVEVPCTKWDYLFPNNNCDIRLKELPKQEYITMKKKNDMNVN